MAGYRNYYMQRIMALDMAISLIRAQIEASGKQEEPIIFPIGYAHDAMNIIRIYGEDQGTYDKPCSSEKFNVELIEEMLRDNGKDPYEDDDEEPHLDESGLYPEHSYIKITFDNLIDICGIISAIAWVTFSKPDP
jgi:hypothetical protein